MWCRNVNLSWIYSGIEFQQNSFYTALLCVCVYFFCVCFIFVASLLSVPERSVGQQMFVLSLGGFFSLNVIVALFIKKFHGNKSQYVTFPSFWHNPIIYTASTRGAKTSEISLLRYTIFLKINFNTVFCRPNIQYVYTRQQVKKYYFILRWAFYSTVNSLL